MYHNRIYGFVLLKNILHPTFTYI